MAVPPPSCPRWCRRAERRRCDPHPPWRRRTTPLPRVLVPWPPHSQVITSCWPAVSALHSSAFPPSPASTRTAPSPTRSASHPPLSPSPVAAPARACSRARASA
eukprot:3454118-Prymnesium_polylepis.1